MKSRLLLVVSVLVCVGLLLVAREAASWRTQTISKANFEARLAPERKSFDLESETLATQHKQLQRLARSKGWWLQALSPDGTLCLVSGSNINSGATMDARTGKIVARLSLPVVPRGSPWWETQFSPRGQFVSFQQAEGYPTLVFDARTGRLLWRGFDWAEHIVFSSDERFAALLDRPSSKHFLLVRDARSGLEIKRLPVSREVNQWNFSRDGNFLLAEVAPGQFQQLRLR